MSVTPRWSYALNQWNSSPTAFVRTEHHERALKTCSVAGFRAVELQGGSGRWSNLGRPEHIILGHGSVAGFRSFLADCAIDAVSSMTWDPTAPAEEERGVPRSTSNRADHDAIVDAARHFLDFLAELGAEAFVVRVSESAWLRPNGPDIGAVAAVHERIGAEANSRGIRLAVDVDCLSALRPDDRFEAFMGASDPALVGLAVDTAEHAVSGRDPAAVIRTYAGRLAHVQLKNARDRDAEDIYLAPFAERALLQGGGGRRIERWFFELGTPGGIVDPVSILETLDAAGYSGWVVVESDQTPEPAESLLDNAWYLRRHVPDRFTGSRR